MKRRSAGAVLIVALSVLCRGGSWQQGEELYTYRLSLPDRNWGVDISFPRSVEVMEDLGKEGYSLFGNQKREKPNFFDPIHWKVVMTPASGAATDTALRDSTLGRLIKKGTVEKSSVKNFVCNHILVSRFLIDNKDSSPLEALHIRLRVLEAYLAKDNTWITITIHAGDLKEDDEQAFCAVLDSVRIVDISNPSTSFDYYQIGHALHLQNQFQKAVGPLSTALSLEQNNRRLKQAQWRTLLVDLIDSLGATRDNRRAKELLDFGVGQDPDYPVFHFGLARYFALRDDLDNTIASLQRAFQKPNSFDFKDGLRNPMSDPSFKQFWKNEKFKKAVKDLKINKLIR
jgi:hypothetical protein